jgi:predicted phosphoribosyltransferase
LSVEPAYIKKETEYLINKTRQLEHRWRQAAGLEERPNVQGKVVIVVDDGVATGMTATAAGRCLKREGAEKVILAAPVVAANTLKSLLVEYDQVIALDIPAEFAAVGQFYSDFRQVEDVEVVQALTQAMNHNLVKSL